ncbi:hypothetical protein HY772_04350 [Candidatus Woesearchaeota archaeon]|nr:hypothetical protein [Candidatus Woesearchaeota archaeon]
MATRKAATTKPTEPDVQDIESPKPIETSTQPIAQSLPTIDDLIAQQAEPLAVELLESRLTAAIHAHIRRLLTSQAPADIAQRKVLLRRIGLIAAGSALSEAFGAFSQDARSHLKGMKTTALPASTNGSKSA